MRTFPDRSLSCRPSSVQDRLARLAGTLAAGLAPWLTATPVHAQPRAAPSVLVPAGTALPLPATQGSVPLQGALAQRRSLRRFAQASLTVAEVGQLLWAAQGVTDPDGRRTAPSAGATYPLVLYLVAGQVAGLATGMYRYLPQGHRLMPVGQRDLRADIAVAAFQQMWLQDAPALLLVAAQPSRTAARYGTRAERYVAMESGAAAQNVLLQAVALGLGGTLVGAFDDAALHRILALPEKEQLLAIIPVGHEPSAD